MNLKVSGAFWLQRGVPFGCCFSEVLEGFLTAFWDIFGDHFGIHLGPGFGGNLEPVWERPWGIANEPDLGQI